VTRQSEKNKITKIWQKVAKKSPSKKNARIANLKVQNIYSKALFKVKNTYNKTGFKIAHLGENQRICSNHKVAQHIAIFFGYFFQQKTFKK
jgi:hypothetical protein